MADAAVVPTGGVPAKTPHIMVVDDSKMQRTILRKWLSDYTVTDCSSGQEALDRLKQIEDIDLVLVDMKMPGLSGLDLLDLINKDDKLSQIPLILMSAADKTAESVATSVQRGSQDYLFKPLIRPLLLRKINTLLQVGHGKRQAQQYESDMEAQRLLVEKKEKEIQQLKEQVSELNRFREDALEAIDTPIQSVTRTITAIMEDPTLNDKVKLQLKEVLSIVTSPDLYMPAFAQLVSSPGGLDPVTQSLLMSEYSGGVSRSNNSTRTFPELIQEDILEGLKTWEFNQWQLDEDHLLPLLKNMFQTFGIIERFNVNPEKLERFIMTIRDNYKANPYHNFRHAFDVTQTVYSLLTAMGAAQYLGHLDAFALLISALCHDVCHPGTNNAFQINTNTELAIQYNDRSVLENMHCSFTFKLLQHDELNILEGLSTEERKEIRKLIIHCILATDPATHFESLSKLQQRIGSGKPFLRESEEDRKMILEALIHLSDISNISKPWEVSKQWSVVLGNEFFMQGDMERERDMPVAPFMDRTKATTAKTSANFIDFVGGPLFRAVSGVLPNLSVAVGYMTANRTKWEEALNESEEKEKEKEKESAS